MKGVYWAWGAVLGDLAVFMGPLPHATSDAAFVQLWLLHAGSCAILATSSLVLMPSKNRATLHWTWLLLFCFAAIAPVLGSLCILLISYTTLRQALDVHNHAKPQTVALPEFEARSQQTSRAGQGAIRSRLTAQVPSNVRMQSLLTLQAVPSRVANPILESLLGDEAMSRTQPTMISGAPQPPGDPVPVRPSDQPPTRRDRSVTLSGPAVTALAAGASDMSGWLMLGLPGALYASGLAEAWIAIGLFIGALLNWIIVAPRLREQTERYGNSLTIPEFLGNRFNDEKHLLRLTASIVIIVFFALYSASGLVAGGKLFQSAFGADYQTGLWITASVVVAYVVLGGFLAVSLTDFVQGTIMAIALVVVPYMAWQGLPEGVSVTSALNGIDPKMTSLFAGTTALGIISTAAWGLGYFGQPHIIVRFMAIRSVKEMPIARNICMVWMAITLSGALHNSRESLRDRFAMIP